MKEEIKAARWSASVAAVSALIGAFIGAGGTAWVNDQNLDAQREAQANEADRERDAKVRDQRRPVYVEFSDAANEWATRQATVSECASLQTCRYDQSDLDDSRYRFQSAVNDLHLYGSPDALSAAGSVTQTLPPPLAGVTGSAEVGEVDHEGFHTAIVEFYDQMCADLSYAPEDCDLGD